ncbi:helix-turn-helix transcriptional regulator [Chloroflexia bacterium SDU3-3]|nr:helix-turn-helix transcriptional regulator [Chloroflexia bacterium SDU3-3]
MGASSGSPYGCAVEATIDVVGGRWKAVILFHLIDGTKRFSELRRFLPKITQRMLTMQLRQLEEDGVICREVFASVPPRVEYSLTEFGRTLVPTLQAMRAWGETYEQRLAARAAQREGQIRRGGA